MKKSSYAVSVAFMVILALDFSCGKKAPESVVAREIPGDAQTQAVPKAEREGKPVLSPLGENGKKGFWGRVPAIFPDSFPDILYSSPANVPRTTAGGGFFGIADGSLLTRVASGTGTDFSFDAGSVITAGPVLISDGEIWLGTEAGIVLGIDGGTGNERIRFDAGNSIAFLTADSGGSLYLLTRSGDCLKYDPDAKSVVWRFETGKGASVLSVSGGTLTVQAEKWILVIDAMSGDVRSRIEITGSVQDSASADAGIAVRLSGGDLVFHSGEHDREIATGCTAGPVTDGTVFAFASGKDVLVFAPASDTVVTAFSLAFAVSSLGIGGTGRIFGTTTDSLFASGEGDTVIEIPSLGHGPVSLALSSEGFLLTATRAGRLLLWSGPGDTDSAVNVYNSVADKYRMPEPGTRKKMEDKIALLVPPGSGKAGIQYDIYASRTPIDLSGDVSIFAFKPEESRNYSVSVRMLPGNHVKQTASYSGNGTFVSIFDWNGEEIRSNVDEAGVADTFVHPFERGKSYWVAVGAALETSLGNRIVFAME